MKHPLQRFGAWATAWTYNDFRLARVKLSLIYIAIIAIVIGVFTFIIIYEVNKELESQSLVVEREEILSVAEALHIVRSLRPGVEVVKTEYTLEDGILTFDALFADGEEAKVELLTGRSYLEIDELNSFWGSFFDELDETIILFGFLVLIVAGTVATFVARITLIPIAEKIKEQDRFIADTSHELRNPLAAVSASLDSLIRIPPKDTQELESILKGMKEEHERLIKITENLLMLTRTGVQSDSEIVPISVSASIATVTKQLDKIATLKKISVTGTYSDAPLSIPRADLESLLFNLIHNAIKFSPAEGVVKVLWTKDKKLIVSDTGVGIAKEDLPNIFERFYKIDAARRFDEESGNGLGLAIVEGIVRKYNATIKVDSAINQGTTITVSFW